MDGGDSTPAGPSRDVSLYIHCPFVFSWQGRTASPGSCWWFHCDVSGHQRRICVGSAAQIGLGCPDTSTGNESPDHDQTTGLFGLVLPVDFSG